MRRFALHTRRGSFSGREDVMLSVPLRTTCELANQKARGVNAFSSRTNRNAEEEEGAGLAAFCSPNSDRRFTVSTRRARGQAGHSCALRIPLVFIHLKGTR